jgi:hypothetical protein
MEPKGLLQRSQELSTDPYPEPDQSSPHKRQFEYCKNIKMITLIVATTNVSLIIFND